MQPVSARTAMPTPALVSPHVPADPGQQPLLQGGISTDLLFQGSREILIDHNGEAYRLRITSNGKLILTK